MATIIRSRSVATTAPAEIVPTLPQMLALWLPLAASMLMMVLEPSVINIGLGRTLDPDLALAAYGVAFSLALVIEAPILMLLDASVARSADRPAFAFMERFTLLLMAGVTVVALIVSMTPLYGLIVEKLMNIPADVAARARPTLQILALWPAPIAWRRTHQGLLIRMGRTMIISIATVVRLVTLAVSMAAGLLLFPHRGAVVAGVAMDMSVTVEAIVVTWAARRALRSSSLPATGSPPAWRAMWRFYLPLVVTSTIQQAARPLLTAGVAAAVLARDSLAAWPVVWALATLIGGPAWSLQQLTNALAAEGEAQRRVRNFALGIGAGFSALLALVALSPLYSLAMGGVYNLLPALQRLAHTPTVLMIPFPFLLGAQGYLRGVLIRRGCTHTIRSAVLANVVVLGVVLLIGTRLLAPTGAVLAAMGTQVALLAELAWLRLRGQCPPAADG